MTHSSPPIIPFRQRLASTSCELTRQKTSTLQINLGLVCNLTCRHCHLEAGPHRRETMARETLEQIIRTAAAFRFKTIDITGGAPEMSPLLPEALERLAPLCQTLMLRSNLTRLHGRNQATLIDLCRKLQVNIIASFPSINKDQADSQRGEGVFDKSLETLQRLNSIGYGQPDTGLLLDLVSNPAGAFLSPDQNQLEKRFRKILKEKFSISFNHLFSFANVPLGRFQQWLEQTGNLGNYLQKLAAGFNPCTIEGLMCRTLISVSWDGFLFDCDFNQAAGLPLAGKKTHITELAELPRPGSAIAADNHCYTCTAGAGFT